MCSTSRTSISPIGITTGHRSICCSIAFIEIKFQQKLCATFKYRTYRTKHELIWKYLPKYSSVIHGVMFSELSNPAGMPRFLVCTGLYSVQMWSAVKGVIFPYWSIITGGMNWSSYEPITANVNFDVFI